MERDSTLMSKREELKYIKAAVYAVWTESSEVIFIW